MDSIIITVEAFPNPTTEEQRLHNQFVKAFYENNELRVQGRSAFHITTCSNGCHVLMTHVQWQRQQFRCMGSIVSAEVFSAISDQFAECADNMGASIAPFTVTKKGIEEILKRYEGWQP
jgi:hypothetical protein